MEAKAPEDDFEAKDIPPVVQEPLKADLPEGVEIKIMPSAAHAEAPKEEPKRPVDKPGVAVKVAGPGAEKPPLVRDETNIRSGMLKIQLETSSVFFGKSRSWKERFVYIDAVDGIYICTSRAAFEKKDKKHMKLIPFSVIAGVALKKPEGSTKATVHECRFIVYIKARAHSAFGPVIELETGAGVADAEEWVRALRQKILVRARVYTVGLNGEFPEHTRGVNPNVAVCFSGGGGRAHVCASGQLRALHRMGVLKKGTVDYLSGVSAGAWATCIYTFYRKGAENDDELLGPSLTEDLKQLTMGFLDNEANLPPILRPATVSMVKVASELVWKIESHELWERSMGKVFLKPFGLNKELPYALAEDIENIKRENPHLVNTDFVVPRSSDRPFWICHGTIIGPEWAKVGQMLPIQFTPLYSGSPYLHKIHYRDRSAQPKKEQVVWVGGGMVDSYAFGGDEPSSLVGSSHTEEIHSGTLLSHSLKNLFKRSTSTPKPATPASKDELPPKKNSLLQTASMPLMASGAFAEVALEQVTNAGEAIATTLKTRAAPLYSSDVADAIQTLNLAPQMIARVFRHAQDALQSHTFYTRSNKRLSGQAIQEMAEEEGVLQKEVDLPFPAIPFSLRHTLGISSDAPSVVLHEKSTFKRLNVQERYWTPVFVAAGQSDGTQNNKDDPSSSLASEFNVAQSIATTHAITMDMGDGGSLDNLGVCGMLQRSVRKLIVFINTNNLIPPPHHAKKEFRSSKVEYDANRRMSLSRMSLNGQSLLEVAAEAQAAREQSVEGGAPATPPPSSIPAPPTPSRRLSLTRRPSFADREHRILNAGPVVDDFPPTYEEWYDDDVLPLFGQSVDEKALNILGTHHSNNHVFPLKDLRPLLRAFQDKMIKGEPPVVRMQHDVLDNPFWGIVGGWTVDVLWCYLDDSSEFRGSLPDDTIMELDKAKGEFARFPNFRTFGNNSSLSFDIALTTRQTLLLSAFTEYMVVRNRELFTEFITEPLPPLERKKKQHETCLAQLEVEGFA